MGERQHGDAEILEVANGIHSDAIRAKYLRQVCADEGHQSRLQRRVATRSRWQFGLRSLLVAMSCVAVLATLVSYAAIQATRMRQMAEMERMRAVQAREAQQRAQAAMQQLQSSFSPSTIEFGEADEPPQSPDSSTDAAK